MAIEGPIKELSLMDLFQLLAMSRKSGILTLDCTRNVGQVYFSSGNIVRALLQSGQEPLGQLMQKAGKLSHQKVDQLLKEQSGMQRRMLFGDLAVEKGAVSKAVALDLLKSQIHDVVFQIMGWEEGYFRFEDMEIDPDPGLGFVAVTENVMMEVSRRLDEWSKIKTKLPDLDAVLALSPASETASAKLDLNPDEWLILANIDGRKTARELIASVGGHEFEMAKVIYGLVATGLVRVVGGKSQLVLAVQETQPDPIREAQDKLQQGHIEDAIEILTGVLQKEPDSSLAHLFLAEAYYQTEAFDEAIMEYKLASKGQEENPDINYSLGFAYAKIGRLELAVERWEKYLQYLPGDRKAGKVQALVELVVKWAMALEEKDAIRNLAQAPDTAPSRQAGPIPELSPEIKSWLEKMKKGKTKPGA
jgi:tetratricopeptide (TPR) repeat protein